MENEEEYVMYLIARSYASDMPSMNAGKLVAQAAHCANELVANTKIEILDECLGEVIEKVLLKNGALVITADHGNAEEVFNLQTGGMDKEHSTNSVPIFIVSQDLMGQTGPSGDPPEGDLSLLSPVGMLADVAPTVLALLGLPQPKEMNGRSLV